MQEKMRISRSVRKPNLPEMWPWLMSDSPVSRTRFGEVFNFKQGDWHQRCDLISP